jgi:uncharacterized protein
MSASARSDRPTIREMTQHACVALLTRQHVGRIAFTFNDRVDIQPIHYVFEAGWLYGRTSHGAKLVTLAHNRWVAFEVDEVRSTFDWESVVVHGSFHRLEPDSPSTEAAAFQRAVELLRDIVPQTLTPDDPAPHRTVFFRMSVGEMTGRMARPAEARG